jgi:hypothetical protein
MITIYVKSKCDNPTLEYPEHKKIASEYIPEVWEHILKTKDAHIVTCSENIVNFIGERIFSGLLNSHDIDLIVENEHFTYDERGALIDWRYGYFLWDKYDFIDATDKH